MFPAFVTAMDDDNIRGEALHVYLYLSKNLDFVSYRDVKVSVIAHDIHMREVTAAWALRRLCTIGYLDRGPKRGRISSYRLVWSIAAVAEATKTSA